MRARVLSAIGAQENSAHHGEVIFARIDQSSRPHQSK